MMRQTLHNAMRRVQRGMSLIEVLVAIAIGLIGILIMSQAYLTSDEFNKATLGAGGAQTNGNVALFTLERDVRMSGFGINHSMTLGCGNMNWFYNGQYSQNLGGALTNVLVAPVVITSAANTPDQITVMYGTGSVRTIPTLMTAPATASELTVDGIGGYFAAPSFDRLLVIDKAGSPCTMMQVSGLIPASSKIQRLSTASALYNPPGGGAFPAYGTNDYVFNLGTPVVRSYTITNDSLRVADPFDLAAGGAAIDLVDGIVDMRAQYGKDTNDDGIVDTYNATLPASATEWRQVLSVRIGLVARVGHYEKPTGANCTATTAAPTWQGGTFDWTNFATVTNQARCYRYRVFETTIPLRNMIWRFS